MKHPLLWMKATDSKVAVTPLHREGWLTAEVGGEDFEPVNNNKF